MKYQRLPKFLADWQALSEAERGLVKAWLAEKLLPVVAQYEQNPTAYVWPKSLRFERLQGTSGICAIAWSFAGPDGRATFEFGDQNGEPIIIWRRIGHHAMKASQSDALSEITIARSMARITTPCGSQ